MLKNKSILLLTLIILLGFFLRTYQLRARFMYSHDQDLAGWFVKDVVIDRHFRLIGQETSTQGIFIGPFYYYLLIPFYLLTAMDPIGGNYLVTILGLMTILSVFYVFSKIFNQRIGFIGSFAYSVSFYTVFNDREVVPTMPVILWSIWFFYALYLILKKDFRSGFLITGILTSLIWHINFALILPVALIPISVYLSNEKVKFKDIIPGFSAFFVTSAPLILFEIRHGFQQFSAFIASLLTPQSDMTYSGYQKFERVWFLMSKNIHGLFMGTFPWFSYKTVSIIMFLIFGNLILKKIIDRKVALLSIFWIFIYLLFFSAYSKIVSEYYLNGSVVIWLMIFSVFISNLLENVKMKHFGFILLSLFLVFNLNKFISYKINESGYNQRKDIVTEIKRDSELHGYPCVSVSYITDPGYDLGYRYFIWQKKLKTAPIGKDVPVYTIVFPLKDMFATDKNMGAIGLIYPDYESYNEEGIKWGCSGEDFNLTNSMFGFTK